MLAGTTPLLAIGLVAVVIGAVIYGVTTTHKRSQAADTDIYYKVFCNLTSYAPDDPIVYPGVPGASHMHSFYGNTTTTAFSNLDTLISGPNGDCINNMGQLDKSAYWVPSLYVRNPDGSSTLQNSPDQTISVYYWKPPLGDVNGPPVQPIPNGLRMIAGDSKSTTPQSVNIVQWDCGGAGPDLPTFPTNCTTADGNQIHASLFFPNCWDGVHLDSADHKSHMAYSDINTGACPADHPVHIPEVNFEVNYPYGSNPNYFLSSGGVYSWHGDFVAAWDPKGQTALVNCINADIKCGAVYYDGSHTIQGESGNTINLNNVTPFPSPSLSPTATPTSSPGGKVGDINGDGAVNIFDLSMLLSAWGTTNSAADINKDGTVNVFDLSTLLSHWGT
jgi:hypothetical protein